MFKKFAIGIGILLIILLGYALNEYRLFSKTYEGIRIDKVSNTNSAFLIVDIQNDLTKETGKVHVDVNQVNQIIPNINKLSGILKQKGYSIIYIKHEYQSPFFKAILKGALTKESAGSDFDERLDLYGNSIFVKNSMDPFSNSRFQEYLISKKIGNLLISGIDANFCIDKTAKSAIEKGYNISIVSDGIAAGSNEIREEKLNEFQRSGVKTIKTVDVITKYE